MKKGLHIPGWLHVRHFFTAFGILILLLLTCRAILFTHLGWDARAYHLPFARGVWALPWKTAFDPENAVGQCMPNVYYYAQGFPKVAEVFQGLFWILTGCINGTVLPHVLLYLLYLRLIHISFRIPVSLLVIGSFACPLIYFHYVDTYIDLFIGLNIALGFFLLSRFTLYVEKFNSLWDYNLLFGLAALVIASNSKFTALLPCLFLLGMAGVRILLIRNINSIAKLKVLMVFLAAALICMAFPIKNYMAFANPVYPVQIKINQKVVFPGPVEEYHRVPQYQLALLNAAPVSFLLSVTDFDYAIRGVLTAHNLDSNTGDTPRYDHPARTGGFGGFYFMTLMAAFLIGVFRFTKIKNVFLRQCLIDATVFMGFTSLLPQSIELRYWLYLPLIMLPIAIKLGMTNRNYFRSTRFLAVLLFIYNLSVAYLASRSGAW